MRRTSWMQFVGLKILLGHPVLFRKIADNLVCQILQGCLAKHWAILTCETSEGLWRCEIQDINRPLHCTFSVGLPQLHNWGCKTHVECSSAWHETDCDVDRLCTSSNHWRQTETPCFVNSNYKATTRRMGTQMMMCMSTNFFRLNYSATCSTTSDVYISMQLGLVPRI